MLLFEKNESTSPSTPSAPLHSHSPTRSSLAEFMEESYKETEATIEREETMQV